MTSYTLPTRCCPQAGSIIAISTWQRQQQGIPGARRLARIAHAGGPVMEIASIVVSLRYEVTCVLTKEALGIGESLNGKENRPAVSNRRLGLWRAVTAKTAASACAEKYPST